MTEHDEKPADSAPDAAQERRRKRRLQSDWESAIEKQIQDAIDRGDFNDLPGRGKPLDLNRDPNTPAEWDAAFRLLRGAGYAPAWIEEDKEIRQARAALFAPLDQYLARLDRGAPAPALQAQREGQFREQAAALNRRIDVFNLRAPSVRLHHARIRIDEEIDRFRKAVEARHK